MTAIAKPIESKIGVKRLNWGCGGWCEPGWINSDQKEGPGILSCDIRNGLPLETDSIDYAVSIHALPEVPYPELVPVLQELRRVIKPGGVLRLALPDLEKGFEAYRRKDRDYFLIPDEDMQSLGGKLVLQLIWYGYSRTPFTYDFILHARLLGRDDFIADWLDPCHVQAVDDHDRGDERDQVHEELVRIRDRAVGTRRRSGCSYHDGIPVGSNIDRK
jgi:SAM-dependent methyltransferase